MYRDVSHRDVAVERPFTKGGELVVGREGRRIYFVKLITKRRKRVYIKVLLEQKTAQGVDVRAKAHPEDQENWKTQLRAPGTRGTCTEVRCGGGGRQQMREEWV
jgi:hypothetical protein